MSWLENLLGRVLAKPIERMVEARVSETLALSYRKGDENYRRLSGNTDRDLAPLAQDRQAQIAYYLWKTNPLASRMLNLKRDLVVGDGFRFAAQHPSVQEVLDRFWRDGVNQMDLTLDQRVLELSMYGEQCYPVFVSPHMGRVRLGYLDPTAIETVVADPENAAVLIGVQTKAEAGQARRYAIILDEDAEAVLSDAALRLRQQFSDGSCLYYSVNRAMNATRGSSDLLPLLDWLDAYENWMFDRIEWASRLGDFIWDVTLRGMNPDQIRQWLDENPPPKRGSIRAHNENVEWDAVNPDLRASDLSEIKKVFLHHILSAEGWPESWFTVGGETTRATAAEQGDPILKSLSRRQKYVSACLSSMGRYAIRQAVNAGALRERLPVTRSGTEQMVEAWEAFKVEAPEIATKDVVRVSQALGAVSGALVVAEQNQWIGREDAAAVFAMLASMLGREISPSADTADGTPDDDAYSAAQLAELRRQLAERREPAESGVTV